jgi:rod shape-determining protein MreD
MRHAIIPVILLFMLAFEGVAIELLPPSIKFAEIYIIPQWVLMFLILVTIYSYTKMPIIPIIYGAVFGLMTDIVYTNILGVYMFVVALAVYVAQLLNRLFQANIFMVIIIATVSLFVLEFSLVFIYSFLGISTMSINQFLVFRFLPTWIANILFIVIIYYPTKQLLKWMNAKKIT